MPPVARITGIGTYLPERVVTNDEVLDMLARASRPYLSPDDLDTVLGKARHKLGRAGSRERRWRAPDQWCTDIALSASQAALADAGLAPEELDLILFTGMSKAFVEPATAHVLRSDLGARPANVLDTQDACTSFAKSLQIADALVRTGRYRNVLVAVGERTFDWADFRCKTVDELQWEFGSLTIGDAAGAVVVQPTEDPLDTEDPFHFDPDTQLVSDTWSLCSIGLNHAAGERYHLYSHSSRLIRTAMTASMQMLARRLGDQPEIRELHFDTLIFHDIGGFLRDHALPMIRQVLPNIPEDYESFFPETGNVASAILPMGLQRTREGGRLRPGGRVLFACPAAGVQSCTLTFRV